MALLQAAGCSQAVFVRAYLGCKRVAQHAAQAANLLLRSGQAGALLALQDVQDISYARPHAVVQQPQLIEALVAHPARLPQQTPAALHVKHQVPESWQFTRMHAELTTHWRRIFIVLYACCL